MEWTFDDFKTDLDALSPEIREKALKIAQQLVKEKNYTGKAAIAEAIIKAEEWFYDLEGW